MKRSMRLVLGVVVLGTLAFTAGCGGEGKPNPALKVPDVPPGSKVKGPALKQPVRR